MGNSPQLDALAATATKGELVILDKTGDTKLVWDSSKTDEVAEVRKTFDNLRKKGYLAYTVKAGGDKGDVIKEFDPNAEKIILAPQMVGG